MGICVLVWVRGVDTGDTAPGVHCTYHLKLFWELNGVGGTHILEFPPKPLTLHFILFSLLVFSLAGGSESDCLMFPENNQVMCLHTTWNTATTHHSLKVQQNSYFPCISHSSYFLLLSLLIYESISFIRL